MPYITVNLSEQENSKIEMFRINRGLKSKSKAIKKMISEKKIRIDERE